MKRKLILSTFALLLFAIHNSFALVSSYVFIQSTGTYTPIVGGSTAIAGGWDDNNSTAQNIGFSFTFNGAAYTQFFVNSNGYITFNGTLAVGQYSPISAGGVAATGVVAALGKDLWDAVGNSPIKYATTGTAPNRVLTVQWANASAFIYSENLNFQIKLYESINKVEIVYGPFSTQVSGTTQVGLRGAGNADFNDRTTASNWSATTAGASNSANCSLSPSVYPANGLIFDWINQTPCTGIPGAPSVTNAAMSSTPCPGFIDTLNASDPNGTFSGISYLWQSAPAATGPWTNITGATSLTYITPVLNTTTWYRLRNKCANSGLTDTSAPYLIPIANPQILTTSPGSSCGPGSIILGATSSGNISWYAGPDYGPVLGTGTTFTTPVIAATTTYYAEPQQGACIGARVPVIATINPTVSPTISITSSAPGTICSATAVTFTATAVNAGAGPLYQWYKNGIQVGPHAPTYTTYNLANGDVIMCIITSTTNCVTPASATSNTITMSVTASVVPSVTVSASPSGAICAGSPVTFTATPANGGPTPSYIWKANGATVGTGSSYSSSSLNNGDTITVELTSNATCATPGSVSSPAITMIVNPIVTPSVSILAGTGNTICFGTPVTFSAAPVNGGGTPGYQWYYNGTPTATTPAYTNASLGNGDQVSLVLTTSAACSTIPTVTSNTITMTVNPIVVPSVSVSTDPGTTVCFGTPVSFTATTTNGGPTPSYQWKKNGGTIVGATTFAYTDNGLNNGDIITVTMASSACASPATITSAPVTMTIIASPTASVLAAGPASICEGQSVTINANTGGALTYQWLQNGIPVTGANSNSFTADLTAGYSVKETNTNGCSDISAPVMVVVNLVPDATIGMNGPSSFCQGDSIQLHVSQGAGLSYSWITNGSAVGSGYTYSAGMTGVYEAVVSNGGCSDTDMISVLELPLPVPAIMVNGKTMWTVGPYVSYQWYYNGVPVGNSGTSYIYTATQDGTYTVMVTNADGCSGTSAPQEQSFLGVSNVVAGDQVSLYPNPNTGTFTVSGTIGSADANVTVEVMDELGRVLYRDASVVPGGRLSREIRLENGLSSGIYLLRISTVDSKTVIPFRKQ